MPSLFWTFNKDIFRVAPARCWDGMREGGREGCCVAVAVAVCELDGLLPSVGPAAMLLLPPFFPPTFPSPAVAATAPPPPPSGICARPAPPSLLSFLL